MILEVHWVLQLNVQQQIEKYLLEIAGIPRLMCSQFDPQQEGILFSLIHNFLCQMKILYSPNPHYRNWHSDLHSISYSWQGCQLQSIQSEIWVDHPFAPCIHPYSPLQDNRNQLGNLERITIFRYVLSSSNIGSLDKSFITLYF